MKKTIITLVCLLTMGISGVLIFLAVVNDREAKKRQQHVKELQKKYEEMEQIVNPKH